MIINDLKNITDPEEFNKRLLEKVAAGKHSEWEFIKNKYEEAAAYKIKKALLKIVSGLIHAQQSTFNTYINQLRNNEDGFNTLLAVQQLNTCIIFYKKELGILQDELHEWDTYVKSGNFLNTLLGLTREEDDLTDFRKKE